MKTRRCALTEYHARAVAAIGRPADLIGFHGQTILHQPDQPCQGRTWQIGDATWTGLADRGSGGVGFSLGHVAAGGEGAPLAPAYHAALASALPRPWRC